MIDRAGDSAQAGLLLLAAVRAPAELFAVIVVVFVVGAASRW